MPTTDTIVRNIFVKAEESITLTNNGAAVVTGTGSSLPGTLDPSGKKILVMLDVLSPSAGDGGVDAAIDASIDEETWLEVLSTLSLDLDTGTFATATGWTAGTGWSIGSSKASSDGSQTGDSDLTLAAGLTPSTLYQTRVTVTRSAGNVTVVVGDQEGADHASSSTFTEYVTCGAGTDFDVRADADFVGDVDTITVKEVTLGANEITNGTFAADTDWTKGDGWTIAAGVASSDGSQAGNADLTQTAGLTPGTVYQVTFTVSGYTAGNVRPVVGDTAGTNRAADGTFVEYITCGSGTDFDLRADADFIGNVDTVLVKAVSVGDNLAIGGLASAMAAADLTLWEAPYWRVRIFTDGTDLVTPATVQVSVCAKHVGADNFYSSRVLTP